jgi:hypothetical protein
MSGEPARTLSVVFTVLATACAPWRSDVALPPGVAAAPVLAVAGWQPPIGSAASRHVLFGPWTADRHLGPDEGWSVIVRHDSSLTGVARCWTGSGGSGRRKGSWRNVPLEDLSCNLILADQPDTMRLEAKADARHPMVGRAASEDWAFELRGADRLRTRSCLVMPTCGWYLTLDGTDIAAVETDVRAWVVISPDLGDEVRSYAALVTGVLLLRAGPPTPP